MRNGGGLPATEGLEADLSGLSKTIKHKGAGISPGIYTVTIKAFDAPSGGNQIFLQNPVQTITVFSDCTTDKWYGIDGAPLTGAGLEIKPIDTTAANTFFVKGTGGALSITGSDANTGISLGSPLASLNAALAKCTGSGPYTIYVDGTVTEPDPLSQFRIYKQVTVKSLSERATIKKNTAFKSLIIIDSVGSLTLENIILDGAYIDYTGIGGLVYNEGTLTLKDGTVLQNGKAQNGGAVYSKGDFNINGNAIVTPSDDNAKGNNDVYLATNTSGSAKIMLNGALTGTGTVVRITPETYATTTQVLTGSAVAAQYTKFAVTPNSSGVWKINDQGKLFLHDATVTGTTSSTDAWKKLKEAVTKVADGGIITIDGEIKATNDSGNFGEILINKNLTIQGADKNNDKLDAHTLNRIFKVTGNGVTLTIKNLTLTGGKASDTATSEEEKNGGGVYVDSGSNLTMTASLIQGCTAGKDGGGIYTKGSTVTMTDSDIKKCEAKSGGAIYAFSNESPAPSVHITNGTIGGTDEEANKATGTDIDSGKGGGIFIQGNDSTLMLEGSATLTGNTAEKFGGGVYFDGGTFTMKGSSRITPDANKNDVYLDNLKMITLPDPLTGAAPVARITPALYGADKKVFTGSAVSINYTKFTVTPEELSSGNTQDWEIKNDGMLHK